MPEVTRVGNYIVVVNTRDHVPPHVHVLFNGCSVRVLITPSGAAYMSTAQGKPKAQEVRRAVEAVESNLAACLAKWKEIHG